MLDSKIRVAVFAGIPLFLLLAVVAGIFPHWSEQLRAEGQVRMEPRNPPNSRIC
jgi:hypothetical protein